MRSLFVWLGDVVGSFCAAFLAYVVVGTAVGRAIATPFNGAHECWPTAFFYSSVAARCDDPLAGALWYGAIELPSAIVAAPAAALSLALLYVDPPDWSKVDSYAVIDSSNLAIGTSIILLMSLAGFVQWRVWTPPLAWLLALAFVGHFTAIAIAMWIAWQ